MSEKSHGGKREGAGRKPGTANPNAGRKKTRFTFDESHYVLQTETMGGLPQPPELWRLVAVHDDYLEFEIVVDGNSKIMIIAKQSSWNND